MNNSESTSIPLSPRAFMLHFLKPYRLAMFVMLSAASISAAAESFQPYIIKLLVDTLGTTADIRAAAFIHHAWMVGLSFAALRLIIVVGWWGYSTLRSRIEPRVEATIRETILQHVLRHSYAWFLNGFSGRIGQRVDMIARSFCEVFEVATDDFIYISVRGLTLLCLLLSADVYLGAGLLLWVLVTIPVNTRLSFFIEEQAFIWITTCGAFTERVVDVCSNIFSVRSNGGGRAQEQEACSERIAVAARHHARMTVILRNVNATRTMFNTLLYAILFIIGFWRWQVGSISVGDFAMALSAGIGMVDVLDGFSKKVLNYSQTTGNLRESLEGLLENLPPMKADGLAFTPGKGAIEFSDISFGYHPDRPILQNFSLNIAAGEKIALVGPSGAGKSTLVALLLGLWAVQQGGIVIDGQDIASLDRESLLRQIAVIPQDTSLFHRTLFENIAYGSPQADQDSVEAAARAASIHDFIAGLPHGYDTLVGERGLKLSGGQRQRIAVARAIHKNAPILLLDEATSALDTESERAIQNALHQLLVNKTVIAIAHRLSTIAHVDRILVLEAGRIVEQGSHAELLAARGRYARLWEMQSGGYLPEEGTDADDVILN